MMDAGKRFSTALLGLGTLLAIALLAVMLIQSPWPFFAEQGRWLLDHAWGRITLLDLYSGFFLALALVWLLEPKLSVRMAMLVLLPLLGNPLLAFWLLWRWPLLKQYARLR